MNQSGNVLILLLSFLAFTPVLAQDEYWIPDSLRQQEENAVTGGVNVGTSFATILNGGSAFSSYVSPYIRYKLNPKWSLEFGASLINTNFDGWSDYRLGEQGRSFNNLVRQEFYAAAVYQATDNLKLRGTIYQSMWNYSGMDNQSPLNFPGTSYSFGMEYQFTENMSIGVEVRQSRGVTPFNSFYSPYGFASPFNRFGVR